MKRIKIFKAYFILWLFVYFLAVSNIETFKEYFYSTLTFNIAIVSILAIGTFMILKGSRDLTMITGTFGVLMYKKRDINRYIEGIEKYFPSNIATKIRSRAEEGMLLFTESEKEEILAWIDEKFNNQNKYNNFFIGTVLMIGLLGTFSGLLGSIASMSDIVSSLAGSDVDIGKVMAGFSIPLSNMAVGFGSSLFGVISAILLSIKGYILNKAQATLLEGVENWLNEKTVASAGDDQKSPALLPQETLNSVQQSFMEHFIEEMSGLRAELRLIGASHTSLKKEMARRTSEMQKNYASQHELMSTLGDTMSRLATTVAHNSELNQNYYNEVKILRNESANQIESLTQIQKATIKNIQLLTEGLRETDATQKQHNKIATQHHAELQSMMLHQQERDNERKVEFFQLVDTLDALNKSIKRSIDNLNLTQKRVQYDKDASKEGKKQNSKLTDYLQHHFKSFKTEEKAD